MKLVIIRGLTLGLEVILKNGKANAGNKQY